MIEALDTEITTLDKCQPGEIVRELGFPHADGFSLVTRDNANQVFTWLIHLGEHVWAERCNEHDQVKVLRYLAPIVLEVDHQSHLDVRPDRLYNKAGVVIFDVQGKFLNAKIGGPYQPGGLLQVRIPDGWCQKYKDQLNGAYFGRWSVSILQNAGRGFNPIRVFEHEVIIQDNS